ncbi:microfibril-associated glycoprotein 4-like [Mytilus californianus]|uniref:microfibril-associated glycoprotein 4-like n=1 Tax=Mytilus californianus TaxID=6549 RepID=UPI0022473736|nr:microfibril-associated glycoprotein 4-like [Mytilus californianus]
MLQTQVHFSLRISKLRLRMCIPAGTILPRECSDIADVKTGVYDIYPDGVLPAVPVYCFVNETRKWTVIQRRINGCTDFYRGWEAYKEGFGNSSGEYWLGNENIHKISSHGRHALRIELSDFDNQVRYAEYEMFSIGDERDGYQLAVNGYSGDAGDSLLAHNGMKFSTFDRDNDISSVKNCAEFHGGAWWYKWCYASNLNGKYLPGRIDYSVSGDKSVVWHSWHGDDYGLKSTNIMMRKY